jgi:hypothetical protein
MEDLIMGAVKELLLNIQSEFYEAVHREPSRGEIDAAWSLYVDRLGGGRRPSVKDIVLEIIENDSYKGDEYEDE